MNGINKLFKHLRQWYRGLYISFPEGYGDPIPLEVEQRLDEVHDHKKIVSSPVEGRELNRRKNKWTSAHSNKHA
jgi:hypothetical protein